MTGLRRAYVTQDVIGAGRQQLTLFCLYLHSSWAFHLQKSLCSLFSCMSACRSKESFIGQASDIWWRILLLETKEKMIEELLLLSYFKESIYSQREHSAYFLRQREKASFLLPVLDALNQSLWKLLSMDLIIARTGWGGEVVLRNWQKRTKRSCSYSCMNSI